MMEDNAQRITDETVSPYDQYGMAAKRTLTVNRNVADIYKLACHLDYLPIVMLHLDTVVEIPSIGREKLWKLCANWGCPLNWDASTVEEVTNTKVAWASTKESEVYMYGIIEFFPKSSTRTEVRIAMRYAVKRRKFGEIFDKYFSHDGVAQLKEDLRRLKQFLETGEIATIDGQPRGFCGRLAT